MRFITDKSLKNFKFWGGAVDHVKELTDDQLEELDIILDNYMEENGEFWTETQVNDWFWFEEDNVAQILGYENWRLFVAENHCEEKISCPSGDYECPYYENGLCTLENAKEECDNWWD